MPEIHSKALGQSLDVERIIDRIDGTQPGPCLVFLAGIHGNEPSGVFAMKQVIQELRDQSATIRGSIVAIAGNLWALPKGQRFQEADLNRLWTQTRMQQIEAGTFQPANEDEQQLLEIHQVIQDLLRQQDGPFYFFDLHTTSGETIPFIPVNDSLLNRKFTQQYPIPLILGIEEHLDGPLLSLLNEEGYVSFGFEAGQHDALSSIDNHKTFAYLSLVFTGAISEEQLDLEPLLQNWKSQVADQEAFFEIYNRYEVQPDEQFVMEPGFDNFQQVRKGELLAQSNGEPIHAPHDATLFMPRYQPKGDDGYFLIRRIPGFFLWLSRWLRALHLDRALRWLPGIRRKTDELGTLIVNKKIAFILATQVLHLLGYRSKSVSKTQLVIRNREFQSRDKEYKKEAWYV